MSFLEVKFPSEIALSHGKKYETDVVVLRKDASDLLRFYLAIRHSDLKTFRFKDYKKTK